MTGSMTATRLIEERQVRARRARALARLAQRRLEDERRHQRAAAMARHPAGGRGLAVGHGGDPPDGGGRRPLLQVVP